MIPIRRVRLTDGMPAPHFTLRSLSGGYRSLSDWRGRRMLLIFIQPHCPFSRMLLQVVAGLCPDPPANVPAPVVITFGEDDENRRFLATYGLRCPILVQGDPEVASAYRAGATPACCLIDEHGCVVDSTCMGGVDVLMQAGIMPGPDWSWSTTEYRNCDYWWNSRTFDEPGVAGHAAS
jgi:AhpC/TSA family